MYPKRFFEQYPPQPESGQGFVLMPFAEQFQEVYDAIENALEGPELNFSCTRADELFGGGHIIEDILRGIGNAEVIIADLTTKNPNVFYELGIAHMVKEVEKILILTQNRDDVPFDLHQFRHIVYQQSDPGLKQLQEDLVRSVKVIAGVSYHFSIRQGEQYEFPHKLMDYDRCHYNFEISEIRIGENSAKFTMKEYRHVLSEPVKITREEHYGIKCGEDVELYNVPWQLILKETDTDKAEAKFHVVAKR